MPKSKQRRRRARRPYYPEPPKKARKPSPRWYGPLVLGLIFLGVLTIVFNYMGLLPGTSHQATPSGLWVGLAEIALGMTGLTVLR